MRNTKNVSDEDCAEKYCERLRQLTGTDFRLCRSVLFIILTDGKGPKGFWKSWKEAKKSLWSSVQIAEIALEKAQLGNNDQDLATELERIRNERDFLKDSVAYFARQIAERKT